MIRLLRHAEAGRRMLWAGPDETRPLTDEGRSQAQVLAGYLADGEVRRILASPYARCVQSVEPLAELAGLPIEIEESLTEGTPPARVEALLVTLEPGTVLCTHGDVASNLIGRLMAHGMGGGRGRYAAKGSIWELEMGPGGRISSGRYLSYSDLRGNPPIPS